jgi:hypothetical protein
MNAKKLSLIALMSCLVVACGKDNKTSSKSNNKNNYNSYSSGAGGTARQFPNNAMSYGTLDTLVRAIEVLPSYHLTKVNDEKVVSSQKISNKIFNFSFRINTGMDSYYNGDTDFVSKISNDKVYIIKQGSSETVFQKSQLVKMISDKTAPKDYTFLRTELSQTTVCYNGQQLRAVEVRHLFSKKSGIITNLKVKAHVVSINLPLFVNPIMSYDDANQVQRYVLAFNNQPFGCR